MCLWLSAPVVQPPSTPPNTKSSSKSCMYTHTCMLQCALMSQSIKLSSVDIAWLLERFLLVILCALPCRLQHRSEPKYMIGPVSSDTCLGRWLLLLSGLICKGSFHSYSMANFTLVETQSLRWFCCLSMCMKVCVAACSIMCVLASCDMLLFLRHIFR